MMLIERLPGTFWRMPVIVLLFAGLMPLAAVAGAQDGGGTCGEPATFIHAIQGSGERTPLAGEKLTIEGVVVADFQDKRNELGGFFVQEEDADADDDPLTSEGIFVDSALLQVDVSAGDIVRVTGTAFELSDAGVTLTQLRRVKSIEVCGSRASVTPVEVTLPVTDVFDWEQWEGMLVTLPQELTVTQLYNLGRYGEVMLSAGGRLFQPTNISLPGEPALEVAAENARRSIILDDGLSIQNADPTRYPPGGLSADNILRSGYAVTGVTGVVDHRYGTYRVYATEAPEFVQANPRENVPDDVGGRLRIASFNVLNYFNGDGAGGGFPTERGADTPEEFERQRVKILKAILALDADVVGLIEIENDGDGPQSAIADLVNGLNAAAGDEVYAYIPDAEEQPLPIAGSDEGGDAIKQAIIYRPAAVTPVGDPVTTLEAPFNQRRPPVAQAFEENATGERFIVVVNHFKSKGCSGSGVDPDTGDGQGCWNNERVQAARTLLAWLATDPTDTGDPDVLVLGDLNAYAMEEPIRVFLDAGYVNLVKRFEGDTDYSYVYYGQAGSLDHALANASLSEQVTGATIWHINADEPRVFDYNVEYKSENHVVSLYEPSPFRSSDHDPVLVGVALGMDELSGEVGGERLSGKGDSTGYKLAGVVGAVAVIASMIGGFVVERGRQK